MEGLGLRESPRRPPQGRWSGCAWWTSLRPASTADVIVSDLSGTPLRFACFTGFGRARRDPVACLRGLGTRRNSRNGAAFNSGGGVPVGEVGQDPGRRNTREARSGG
jgi:hypothetical protein